MQHEVSDHSDTFRTLPRPCCQKKKKKHFLLDFHSSTWFGVFRHPVQGSEHLIRSSQLFLWKMDRRVSSKQSNIQASKHSSVQAFKHSSVQAFHALQRWSNQAADRSITDGCSLVGHPSHVPLALGLNFDKGLAPTSSHVMPAVGQIWHLADLMSLISATPDSPRFGFPSSSQPQRLPPLTCHWCSWVGQLCPGRCCKQCKCPCPLTFAPASYPAEKQQMPSMSLLHLSSTATWRHCPDQEGRFIPIGTQPWRRWILSE